MCRNHLHICNGNLYVRECSEVDVMIKAKDYLNRYKKNVLKIKNKKNEIAILNDERTNTAAQIGGERVQTSGISDKVASSTSRIVDLQNEIRDCERELKEITDTIESLDNADHYDILHKRYVQGKSYKEIGIGCGMDKEWATTMHGRALKNVQTILDGRESNG